ncbi:helix-turn-helix transcriptional regulator [Enterococcus avium]|uniref:helix-turn-helix transcriptional regulator n=1 Tax=Enterococcus avium TaxID=33945 RepID=UPI00288E04CA|nr:helix-turn-helix transcriptional regulator [Enterococcus avium]MDT2450038.1 helix-turn-helix transcriptional regulator [Enterococcus avium]
MKVTLKALRVNLGLTQPEMAKLIGVSKDTWYNYENYKTFPDVPVIERITTETGVNYNDIIFLPPNYGLTVKIKDKQPN